jgi:hypothetical protein
LEDMFRRRLLQKAFKGFKYHLVLMIYNFLILVHSSKAGPDFEKIINAIDDDETMREIAEPGINSIVNALKRLGMSRQDGVRSREVTALIVREMESAARAR